MELSPFSLYSCITALRIQGLSSDAPDRCHADVTNVERAGAEQHTLGQQHENYIVSVCNLSSRQQRGRSGRRPVVLHLVGLCQPPRHGEKP